MLYRIIWNISEWSGIGLGRFAPYVFGKMIGSVANPTKGDKQMSKFDLTEILCQYAETCGLDPSESDDLYFKLQELANEVTDTIDLIASEGLES